MSVGRTIAAATGVALVGVHAFLLPILINSCRRDSLEVRVTAPNAAAALSVDAELPADIYDRVQVLVDGKPADLETANPGPGMHRVEWAVRYRGDFERRVGLTQVIGPFQDIDNPPCSVRLLVGQTFLDDGQASEGTVAHLVRQIIQKNMAGFKKWPIGTFFNVSKLAIRWAEGRDRLEIKVELAFTKGTVPITLAIFPSLYRGKLELQAVAAADVDLDSRIYQWVADLFNADSVASATAEDEVQAALRDAFRPPPPVPLPGGRRLVFRYCPHQDVDVVDGRYIAVPLAIHIEDASRKILPVSFGPIAEPPVVDSRAPLALEFTLDALNTVLYYLWRTDFLDEELARAGIDERFNKDSVVQQMLSIRLGDIRLSLPPTISNDPIGPTNFALSAEATLAIRDGDKLTPARAFGSIGFDFVGGDSAELVAKLVLRDLALTCEPEPGLLEPCYADLVAQAKTRSDVIHGELTRLFTRKFNDIVVNRDIGTDETMARFHVARAQVHAAKTPPTGIVRVDLFGRLKQ